MPSLARADTRRPRRGRMRLAARAPPARQLVHRAPSGRAGAGTAARAHAAGAQGHAGAGARWRAPVQQRPARQELVHQHVRPAGRDRAQELHRVRVVHLLQHVQLRPARGARARARRSLRRSCARPARAEGRQAQAEHAAPSFGSPARCAGPGRAADSRVSLFGGAAWATLAQCSSGGRRTAAHVK